VSERFEEKRVRYERHRHTQMGAIAHAHRLLAVEYMHAAPPRVPPQSVSSTH
jgi:hypothetical protein